MTPSTKVFATLSLSAAVGHKIKSMTEHDETLKALGLSLYNAGYEATGSYPYPELSLSKTEQICSAVESLLKEPANPEFILSMLIAGLVDIQAKVKKERKELIEPVIVCAQACLDSFDREPDHGAAWARYEKWVAS